METVKLQRMFLTELTKKDNKRNALITPYGDSWMLANLYAAWVIHPKEMYLNPQQFESIDGLKSVIDNTLNHFNEYEEVIKVFELIDGKASVFNDKRKLLKLESAKYTVYCDKNHFKYFNEEEKIYIKDVRDPILAINKDGKLVGFVLPVAVNG